MLALVRFVDDWWGFILVGAVGVAGWLFDGLVGAVGGAVITFSFLGLWLVSETHEPQR